MDCYVLEIKKVHGTRITNDEKLASVYYTNDHADLPQYIAPRFGKYVRAYAVQAETIEDAFKQAVEKFNITSDGESR